MNVQNDNTTFEYLTVVFLFFFVSSPAECPRSGGRWQWKTRRPYQRAAAVRPLHPAGPASSRDSDPARAVMPQRWRRLTLTTCTATVASHQLFFPFWFELLSYLVLRSDLMSDLRSDFISVLWMHQFTEGLVIICYHRNKRLALAASWLDLN